jgi:hypothetical protein
LHRKAFKDCFYKKQTYSHKNRQLNKSFEAFFGADKAYEQIYSKHFKKHYAGKLTKRYLKLNNQLQKADEISVDELTDLTRI